MKTKHRTGHMGILGLFRRRRTREIIGTVAFVALGSMGILQLSHAATRTWDFNAGTAPNPNDGAGTWNAAGNWWTGSTSTTWNNGALDDAFFGTGAAASNPFTVDLGGEITANTVTFSNQNYTISNTGGFTLTVQSGVTANVNATINSAVALGAANTWNVAVTRTLTVGGSISGGSAFTKTGSGTLVFNAANTYSGDTRIQAGVLTLGHASALQNSTLNMQSGDTGVIGFGSLTSATFGGLAGTRSIVLQNASSAAVALTVGGNGASTSYSGNLTGSGRLIKTGSGTLTLSGSNTYSGGTTLSGGTLSISADSQIGGASSAITFSGGTLQVTGTALTNLNSHTLNTTTFNGGLDIASAGNTFTLSQALSGSGGLTKAGAGTLVLTSASTYTGATNISAGTLRLGMANAIGSGSAVNVSGGATFGLNNFNVAIDNLTGSGSVTLGSSALTIGTNFGNFTFSGAISGTGSVTKVSDFAAQIFSTANSYSGATIITGGTLQADSGVGLPAASNLVLNGGTLGNNGTPVTFNRSLGTGPGQVQWTADGGFTAFDAPLTVLLNNSNATPLVWGSTANFIASGQELLFCVQFFAATSQVDFQNSINLNSASRTINVEKDKAGTSAKFSGVLSGTGASGVNKVGLGLLILSGANTYAGATTLSQGVLQANSGVGLPANSNLTFSATQGNSVLQNDGSVPVSFTRTIGSGAGQVQWTSGTFGGFAAQTAKMTVLLNNSNATPLVWGNTGFNPGILMLGSIFASAQVEFQNSINLNGTSRMVDVTQGVGSDSALMSGVLSGTGASGLIKSGTGRLILTGLNTYAGVTNIAFGVLQANSGVGLPTASNLTFSGAFDSILQSDGAIPVSFTRSIGSGAGQVQWTPGQSGGFSANGAKLTVLLNNSNATPLVYGSTGFNFSLLTFGSPTANAQTEFQNSINLGSSGSRSIIVFAGTVGDSALMSGVLSGTGTAGIFKSGPGLLILSGANTYPGITTIGGGTLRATLGVGLPNASTVGFQGGVFESESASPVSFTRSLGNAAGQVSWGFPYAGGFSAHGAKLTVLLNNSNATPLIWGSTPSFITSSVNFTPLLFGSPTANAQVEFQNSIDFGGATRPISVTAGAGGDSALMSGSLSNGGLTKVGTGRLILSGNSTYTGPTTVSTGTLVVSGSLSGTTVTVDDVATLNLTGTISAPGDLTVDGRLSGGSTNGSTGIINGTGGRIAVNSGGHVSPGLSLDGLTDKAILTATSLSANAGAHLDIQLGGTTAGTLYDQVAVNSASATAIDLNADNGSGGTTLNLTIPGYTWTYGDKFFVIKNSNAAGGVHGMFANSTTVLVDPLGTFNTITVGGFKFAIGYAGNSGTNSFTGGNDVVLMAVPEPGASAALAWGFGMLLGLRRWRARTGLWSAAIYRRFGLARSAAVGE